MNEQDYLGRIRELEHALEDVIEAAEESDLDLFEVEDLSECIAAASDILYHGSWTDEQLAEEY